MAKRQKPKPAAAVVYFIQTSSGPIKIGKAAKPKIRLSGLQSGIPERLTLIHTTDEAEEGYFLNWFAPYRIHGEWFKCQGELAEFLGIPEKIGHHEPWPTGARGGQWNFPNHPPRPRKLPPPPEELDDVGRQWMRDMAALKALGIKPISIFEGPYQYRIVPFWQTAAGWWGDRETRNSL